MALHKPKRELLAIWRLYLILCALIPAFLISLFWEAMTGLWLLLTGLWLVLFVGLYSFFFPAAYRARAFAVERERVVAYGGVIYRFTHSLPIANIQYITLMSSPLDRLFRICSLVLVAPGGKMVISGLTRTDGQSLVSILTEATADGGSE